MGRAPMPKDRRSSRKPRAQDDDEEDAGWKSWARDILIALVIMAVVLVAIFVYTGVWPPLVVVESDSMQHSPSESFIGVIDTGDLVFVQAAPTRADVVTYVQGRATGYSTYGDYGDVIIFREFNAPGATPIIHRAILYVVPNGTAANVPDLALLPAQDWRGITEAGQPTNSPYDLRSVTIYGMGYRPQNITFTFADISRFFFRGPGYLTMGDHNAPNYDAQWFPIQSDIIGHARGEIPWFGLIKLLITPAPNACCPLGWGDYHAPANSWTALALSLVFLVALPFILEAAGWAWGKYAWPRLKPLWTRLRKPREEPKPPPEDLEDSDAADEPREGSSGP